MNNFGFIHDELDIQILILYILEKLPSPIEHYKLSDLVLFDGGFTWFDYSQCLAKLIRTEHVTDENGCYQITEKGRRNVNAVGSSLPYTVRAKAGRLCAPVAAAMRRSSMIETAAEPKSDGSQIVSFRMSDGMGELIALRLAVPDEKHAEAMQKRFREHAEEIYNDIILLMTEEGQIE